MSGFLKLPPEIREKIYDDLLVVGTVFPYTIAKSYEDDEPDYGDNLMVREMAAFKAPETALLHVCKAIHAEAEPILYSRNQIMLPTSHLTARFFERSLHNDIRRSWVKSVGLHFEASDMSREDREVTLDEQLELAREDMLFPEKNDSGSFRRSKGSADIWVERLHEAYKTRLASVVWPRKASFVTDHLQLEELELILRTSRCVQGCCEMSFPAIDAMKSGFAKGMPRRVSLIGSSWATESVVTHLDLWTSVRLSESSCRGQLEEMENHRKVLLDFFDRRFRRFRGPNSIAAISRRSNNLA